MKRMSYFCRLFITRFFEDLVAVRAASLAFTTLLSIVPLFIFIFYILSFFPTLSQASHQMEALIVTHFVASSATLILNQLHIFVANVHHLSWINVFALAFIAGLLIFNIVDAINGVWRVKMTGVSAFALFVYWIALAILPVIFAFILFLASYLMSVPLLLKASQVTAVQLFLLTVLPCLLEWVTFSLFHFLMPSCRVRWRYALAAGLITMLAFEIAKFCFVQYIHYFHNYQLFYGALASIPIFFLWVFLVWLIIISASLICHLLQENV